MALANSRPPPCGSSDDLEQPVPPDRPGPAPELPGAFTLGNGEEDDLRAADQVGEGFVADLITEGKEFHKAPTEDDLTHIIEVLSNKLETYANKGSVR